MLSFFISHSLDFLVVLWVIAIARSVLFWLYFIQLKQYRPDRIWAEIKLPKFWRIFFSNYRILILVLLIAWELIVRFGFLGDAAFASLFYLVIVFFLVWDLVSIRLIIKGSLKLPALTIKVWILFIVVILIELYAAWLYLYNPEQLLAIEVIQPVIVFIVFLIVYAPNLYLQHKQKKLALNKLQNLNGLTVIGITGSYGKTSTKEFLAHILSTKFKTLKTPEHVNVDTGIAKFVLQKLKKEHEVFVVEMGADRPKDIKKICDVVLPNYAILTGLNFQHFQYFKNFDSLANTKFELVDAVKTPQNIVVNAESKELIAEAKKRGLKPIFYGQNERAFLEPTKVSFSKDYIHFEIEHVYFRVHIFGEAMLNNLLGAITIAHVLGMSLEEIAEATQDLNAIESTMEMKKGLNGALFIDDSYNANTTGVITALHDLDLTEKKKKILVFREVIELGKKTKDEHKLIAEHIAQKIDNILLLTSPMHDFIERSLLDSGFSQEQIFSDSQIDILMKKIDKHTVVLFEGPGTKSIMDSLL